MKLTETNEKLMFVFRVSALSSRRLPLAFHRFNLHRLTLTLSIGIAKLTPAEEPEGDTMAVLMPTRQGLTLVHCWA
jgi:hypothetical protein